MVMLPGLADLELDGDLGIETRRFARLEIRGSVERQAIGALDKRIGGQQVAEAAVAVGGAAAEFLPRVTRLSLSRELPGRRRQGGRSKHPARVW